LSDFQLALRQNRRLRLTLSLSLLAYSLAIIVFFGMRLVADYHGSRPPVVPSAIAGTVAVGALGVQLGAMAALLRRSKFSGAELARLVVIGVCLSLVALIAILLIARGH
jgi:hypothetical protein